jgi:lysyl-tRNA synthetase class II
MKNFSEIIEEMRKYFISIERYELEVPQLKNIIYGAIGMMVVAVLSAWLSFVVGGVK